MVFSIKSIKENEYIFVEISYPGYSIINDRDGRNDMFYSLKFNNSYESKKIEKLFNKENSHHVILKNNFNQSNYLIDKNSTREKMKTLDKNDLIEFFFSNMRIDSTFKKFYHQLINKKFYLHTKDMYLNNLYKAQVISDHNKELLHTIASISDLSMLGPVDKFSTTLMNYMRKNCILEELPNLKKLICDNFIVNKSEFAIILH